MNGTGSEATLRSPRLEWLPPLMVGASAAVAAEVALGVLLYGGTGFVRSLTTILAVEGIAFGGGLWSAPRPGRDVVDRLRHRWIFCLLAYLTAAVFGTLWSILPELGAGALGQGLGLAALAGLPLFAAGSVLGGIGAVAVDDPGGNLSGPAPAAALGGALGFVLTGFLLPIAPMPGSLLVVCLVLLSTGGMAYGGVLAWRTELEVRARRPTATGDVRVEDRRLPVADVAERVLLDHGHVRRRHDLEGTRERPWDVTAWRTRMPDLDTPVRVLLVGGGGSSAPHAILREHPLSTVDVLERTPAVVELGRDWFGTGLAIASDERLRVLTGNFDDLASSLERPYDLILVDADALRPLGGRTGLSSGTLERLDGDLLRPGGFVVWGPDGT